MQGLWRLSVCGDLVSQGGWVLEGYAPRSPREKCEWQARGLVEVDGKLTHHGQHTKVSSEVHHAVPEPGHH